MLLMPLISSCDVLCDSNLEAVCTYLVALLAGEYRGTWQLARANDALISLMHWSMPKGNVSRDEFAVAYLIRDEARSSI